MGRVERQYTQLLTKALFRKMRKERFILYAITALLFLYDLIVVSTARPNDTVLYMEYYDYTFWALLFAVIIITYNILGSNQYVNLSFIPNTKRTRYVSTVINQVILIIFGQIAGLILYFIQYLIQGPVVNAMNKNVTTIIYPKIHPEVIAMGSLLFLIIGIIYVVTVMLARRLISYYSKVTFAILLSLTVLTVIQGVIRHRISYNSPKYLLEIIGKYLFKYQTYASITLKLIVLAICIILVQFGISKLHNRKPSVNRALYWTQIGLLTFCCLFILYGAKMQEDCYGGEEDTETAKEPPIKGVKDINIKQQVGDAKDYVEQPQLSILGTKNDMTVLTKRYKANKNGKNPIWIQYVSRICSDKYGYADKINIKLEKLKTSNKKLSIKVDSGVLCLKQLKIYRYALPYMGYKYIDELSKDYVNVESYVVVHYPDSIKWSKVLTQDNFSEKLWDNGVNNTEYTNYIKGGNDISSQMKKKIEGFKIDN